MEHMLDILSVCLNQFKCESIIRPKKLNSCTLSICKLSILRSRSCMFLLVFWNVMYIDLAAFIDNLFIFSHSFTLDSSLLIELHRSMLTFRSANAFKVLDKVVSSAYMIKLKILVALGKSLKYITNNNGPKRDVRLHDFYLLTWDYMLHVSGVTTSKVGVTRSIGNKYKIKYKIVQNKSDRCRHQ